MGMADLGTVAFFRMEELSRGEAEREALRRAGGIGGGRDCAGGTIKDVGCSGGDGQECDGHGLGEGVNRYTRLKAFTVEAFMDLSGGVRSCVRAEDMRARCMIARLTV